MPFFGVPSQMRSTQGVLISRHVVQRSIAAATIAILLLPNVVWILSDRRLWPWDQSYYGTATLDLWGTHGVRQWLSTMLSTLHMMPPMLVWTAQFLVPLHRITNDFESAILLVNVLFVFGMVALTYSTASRMRCDLTERLCAIVLTGGSVLIVAMVHQFFVEICQTFAVTCFIAVSWQIERRSSIRSSALIIFSIAIAQAAKAQSFIFWLPLLTYCFVVLGFTRGRARPAPSTVDFVLLCGALAFSFLVLAWYWLNWKWMMAHFAFATSTLAWGGHPVDLTFKIPLWLNALSLGIAPVETVSVLLLALILAGLAFGLKRSLASQFNIILGHAIDNGTVLALALAGTVAAMILAYSLQINEDDRYLTAIIPFVATLTAWSLSVLRKQWLSLGFLAVLTVNATVNNALSLGFNPLNLSQYGQIVRPNEDVSQRTRLEQVVAATCTPETANRWIILAVNYAWLNANEANFFAAKDASTMGHRCLYGNFPLFMSDDIDKRFAYLASTQAYYVITQDPSSKATPDSAPAWINASDKPVAERLAHDRGFALNRRIGDILIYLRKQ